MSLNTAIKQLEDLKKSIGTLSDLANRIKTQAVEVSGLSEDDKKRMSNVLNSLNFEELAKKNTTPEQLKDIINERI